MVSTFFSFGSIPNLLDLDDFSSDKENGSVSPKSNSNSQLFIDQVESTGKNSFHQSIVRFPEILDTILSNTICQILVKYKKILIVSWGVP